MKRAEPGEILAGLLQTHVFADDANNVRLLLYAIRKRTSFSHSMGASSSVFHFRSALDRSFCKSTCARFDASGVRGRHGQSSCILLDARASPQLMLSTPQS